MKTWRYRRRSMACPLLENSRENIKDFWHNELRMHKTLILIHLNPNIFSATMVGANSWNSDTTHTIFSCSPAPMRWKIEGSFSFPSSSLNTLKSIKLTSLETQANNEHSFQLAFTDWNEFNIVWSIKKYLLCL